MHETPSFQRPGPLNRRRLVALALAAPMAALATGARAEQCVSEDDLSASELSMRKALRYEEPSTDPAKLCGGCAFYTSESSSCGQCKLLNGPASAAARCGSWAAKAK